VVVGGADVVVKGLEVVVGVGGGASLWARIAAIATTITTTITIAMAVVRRFPVPIK